MNRRIAAAFALTIPIVGALYACSDSLGDAAYGNPSGANDGSARADGGSFETEPDGVGQTSGVVLVHGAAFPSFRICFENLPNLVPQPDQTVMPEANVVGVEVGSIARIDPTNAPGTVYVIEEQVVRSTPKNPTARKCGELICKPGEVGPACLRKDSDYHEAGSISEALGKDRVHLLVVTGCGGQSFLARIGIDSKDCGNAWSSTTGSLKATPLPLLPSPLTAANQLPVQLVHLSTPLELEVKKANATLEVAFDALGDAGSDGGKKVIASSPKIFEPSDVTNVPLPHDVESVYGTYGFQVVLSDGADGGDAGPSKSGTVLLGQSLAQVQELSSPGSVPTSYYAAASNYALLLLGDPRIARFLQDGGPNPSFDQRRGLHLIAIPVKEPTDGGADGGGGTDLPLPEAGSGN